MSIIMCSVADCAFLAPPLGLGLAALLLRRGGRAWIWSLVFYPHFVHSGLEHITATAIFLNMKWNQICFQIC